MLKLIRPKKYISAIGASSGRNAAFANRVRERNSYAFDYSSGDAETVLALPAQADSEGLYKLLGLLKTALDLFDRGLGGSLELTSIDLINNVRLMLSNAGYSSSYEQVTNEAGDICNIMISAMSKGELTEELRSELTLRLERSMSQLTSEYKLTKSTKLRNTSEKKATGSFAKRGSVLNSVNLNTLKLLSRSPEYSKMISEHREFFTSVLSNAVRTNESFDRRTRASVIASSLTQEQADILTEFVYSNELFSDERRTAREQYLSTEEADIRYLLRNSSESSFEEFAQAVREHFEQTQTETKSTSANKYSFADEQEFINFIENSSAEAVREYLQYSKENSLFDEHTLALMDSTLERYEADSQKISRLTDEAQSIYDEYRISAESFFADILSKESRERRSITSSLIDTVSQDELLSERYLSFIRHSFFDGENKETVKTLAKHFEDSGFEQPSQILRLIYESPVQAESRLRLLSERSISVLSEKKNTAVLKGYITQLLEGNEIFDSTQSEHSLSVSAIKELSSDREFFKTLAGITAQTESYTEQLLGQEIFSQDITERINSELEALLGTAYKTYENKQELYPLAYITNSGLYEQLAEYTAKLDMFDVFEQSIVKMQSMLIDKTAVQISGHFSKYAELTTSLAAALSEREVVLSGVSEEAAVVLINTLVSSQVINESSHLTASEYIKAYITAEKLFGRYEMKEAIFSFDASEGIFAHQLHERISKMDHTELTAFAETLLNYVREAGSRSFSDSFTELAENIESVLYSYDAGIETVTSRITEAFEKFFENGIYSEIAGVYQDFYMTELPDMTEILKKYFLSVGALELKFEQRLAEAAFQSGGSFGSITDRLAVLQQENSKIIDEYFRYENGEYKVSEVSFASELLSVVNMALRAHELSRYNTAISETLSHTLTELSQQDSISISMAAYKTAADIASYITNNDVDFESYSHENEALTEIVNLASGEGETAEAAKTVTDALHSVFESITELKELGQLSGDKIEAAIINSVRTLTLGSVGKAFESLLTNKSFSETTQRLTKESVSELTQRLTEKTFERMVRSSKTLTYKEAAKEVFSELREYVFTNTTAYEHYLNELVTKLSAPGMEKELRQIYSSVAERRYTELGGSKSETIMPSGEKLEYRILDDVSTLTLASADKVFESLLTNRSFSEIMQSITKESVSEHTQRLTEKTFERIMRSSETLTHNDTARELFSELREYMLTNTAAPEHYLNELVTKLTALGLEKELRQIYRSVAERQLTELGSSESEIIKLLGDKLGYRPLDDVSTLTLASADKAFERLITDKTFERIMRSSKTLTHNDTARELFSELREYMLTNAAVPEHYLNELVTKLTALGLEKELRQIYSSVAGRQLTELGSSETLRYNDTARELFSELREYMFSNTAAPERYLNELVTKLTAPGKEKELSKIYSYAAARQLIEHGSSKSEIIKLLGQYTKQQGMVNEYNTLTEQLENSESLYETTELTFNKRIENAERMLSENSLFEMITDSLINTKSELSERINNEVIKSAAEAVWQSFASHIRSSESVSDLITKEIEREIFKSKELASISSLLEKSQLNTLDKQTASVLNSREFVSQLTNDLLTHGRRTQGYIDNSEHLNTLKEQYFTSGRDSIVSELIHLITSKKYTNESSQTVLSRAQQIMNTSRLSQLRETVEKMISYNSRLNERELYDKSAELIMRSLFEKSVISQTGGSDGQAGRAVYEAARLILADNNIGRQVQNAISGQTVKNLLDEHRHHKTALTQLDFGDILSKRYEIKLNTPANIKSITERHTIMTHAAGGYTEQGGQGSVINYAENYFESEPSSNTETISYALPVSRDTEAEERFANDAEQIKTRLGQLSNDLEKVKTGHKRIEENFLHKNEKAILKQEILSTIENDIKLAGKRNGVL